MEGDLNIEEEFNKPKIADRILAGSATIHAATVGCKRSNDMRTIITVGLLFCFGCGGQRSQENKDFIELRDKLPKIETPISFNSNTNIDL